MSYKTNRKTGGLFRIDAQGGRHEVEDSELNDFLATHIYSYRDVPIGEFARLYRLANYDGQVAIREKYRSLESGRLHASLDAFHRFIAALDADERELFKSRNPELMRMVNEFAVVEDLGEF